MGHTAELRSKAQMDLGTTVPYISPPLIHAQFSERIKESKRHSLSEKLNGCILGWLQKPINALLKGTLHLTAWFSHHHYLTVCELKRRTCQLVLVSVRFFCFIIAN